MLTREPASFWRENAIAVVILLRVLMARMSWWRNKLSNVRGFIILRQSGGGLNSFNRDNSADFFK